MYKTAFTLLVAGLTAPAAIAGPEEEHDADELEEVVVRAAPLGRSADELTQPAIVLSKEELLLKAQQSIGETLANELGVSSTYFGPVAGRPVIRGQAGPRVSVLEGGIGALDVSDISPDHAVPVEPLLADGIEIIRGPATLLYGSTAAGGVVNVIDNRIPEALAESPVSGAFEFRGDTAAEERSGVARLDGSIGVLAWHLDGFARQTQDVKIPDFGTADAAVRPDDEPRGTLVNSFGETHGYAVGASYIGEKGFFGAAFSAYENDYGLPGPEKEDEEGGDPGLPVAAGPFIELEQTRLDVRAGVQLEGLLERLRFRFGTNDYEHAEIEPSGELATQFENDAWEARFELVHAAMGNWRGALGVQMTDRDFSALGDEAFIPPTMTESLGFFLVEEYELESARIELGARLGRLEHDPARGLSGYDENAVSFAAGVVWEFGAGYDLSVNLSRSERHPAAEELYSNGPHLATGLFEIGLLAEGGMSVDEEVSSNLDVSVHYHSDAVSWQAGVFYNDAGDYIFLDETGELADGLPVAFYRQADAEFYGYEAAVEFHFARGAESGWNLRLFSDYVRGRTDTADLPRIQPGRLGAELDYQTAMWSAGLNAIYHAEQDEVSSFQTDSFTMLNADFTYALAERGPLDWQFFVKASNLLDEDARRSTSFRAAFVPLPGISLHAGLRARFD